MAAAFFSTLGLITLIGGPVAALYFSSLVGMPTAAVLVGSSIGSGIGLFAVAVIIERLDKIVEVSKRS